MDWKSRPSCHSTCSWIKDLRIGLERDPEHRLNDNFRVGLVERRLEEPSGKPRPVHPPVRRAPPLPALIRRPLEPERFVIVVLRSRLWPDRDGWVDEHESLHELRQPSGKEGSDIRAIRGGDHRCAIDARGTHDGHRVGHVVGESVARRRAIAPTRTARVEGDNAEPWRQVRDEWGRHPGVDEVPGGHDEDGRLAITERLPGDLDSIHVGEAGFVRCRQAKVHRSLQDCGHQLVARQRAGRDARREPSDLAHDPTRGAHPHGWSSQAPSLADRRLGGCGHEITDQVSAGRSDLGVLRIRSPHDDARSRPSTQESRIPHRLPRQSPRSSHPSWLARSRRKRPPWAPARNPWISPGGMSTKHPRSRSVGSLDAIQTRNHHPARRTPRARCDCGGSSRILAAGWLRRTPIGRRSRRRRPCARSSRRETRSAGPDPRDG